MSFIILLLDWYHKNKRALPWREQNSVFEIWLSEIILQQTRVNQGLEYYHKFTDHFADVQELANADEQFVLNLWQGLGYYTRARNLHKTAKIVANEMGGQFPNSFKDLKALPGIGPYTAAAIASICFDEKVPAIDGNAYRVNARLFGLDKDISESNAHQFFFHYVLDIMPNQNAGDFNQAIMELGARVCLPKSPLCSICPISATCVAFQTGNVSKYPVKTKKVKVRKRNFHYFFVQDLKMDAFLVKKRSAKDVWQNLFDLPLLETKKKCFEKEIFAKTELTELKEIKHILTHQHLHIKFYAFSGSVKEFENKFPGDYLLISPEDMDHTPFPKPIADFLHLKMK